jgi:hypothetical protein
VLQQRQSHEVITGSNAGIGKNGTAVVLVRATVILSGLGVLH